jgi:pimeloyl-ACP methyl ester carboxylesterase
VSDLPPQGAQGRFQLVFRRFIGVFARREHPLALFLDDLQWLDAATLDLLENLLTRPDVQHLLLIGAYRDNEVNSAHPLMRKLEAIRQAGAIVQEIILAPLTREDLGRLIADRYTLFMQDYGGPVGFRMALAHPERVQAMIIQNAVSHEEGLSPLWAVRRSFWQDRQTHEAEVRTNLLSLEATRKRHLGVSPDPTQYDPDLWVDEYYFLNQPGQADIQLDLFYDYQNNVKSYPKWQQWLRDNKPPLLVLWGRYDTSFTVAGGEAYRKDDPQAEVHILDAGHFALDLKPKEIIRLTHDFMASLER